MAEATCVMHPFSYSTSMPSFSNETHEENPIMYGIGESISFGRYVCEDLEWEKWSSFNSSNNRNRYVAEAEKYSKPGSVAQKKAYFEAHFKRLAALKAAALLEQANAAQNDHVTTSDENINSKVTKGHEDALNLNSSLNLIHIQASNYEQGGIVEKHGENNDTGEFKVHQNEVYLNSVADEEHELNDHIRKEADLTPPPPPPLPNHKSSQKYEVMKAGNVDVRNEESSEIETLTQMTQNPLQEKNSVNKEEASTKVRAVIKRNPPLSSYISSAIVDGRGQDNGNGSGSDKSSLFGQSPAKSATSVNTVIHPGKENYATPIKNKSSINCDVQKKKTPLRMSINREFNRILSPVIKKLGSSSKTSTPSKTPANKASMNNIPQHPPMTPDLTNRGATSPRTGRSKISSPIIPNSFCLTGERTARRKQKLEEKFNAATATERAPQPSKFKEKAEAELNKFRQSFCFKVMSSPDYYGDNGTFKSPKHKNESTQRKSPNGGRQPNNNKSTSQNKSALPPRKPSVKQIGLRSKRTTLTPS